MSSRFALNSVLKVTESVTADSNSNALMISRHPLWTPAMICIEGVASIIRGGGGHEVETTGTYFF